MPTNPPTSSQPVDLLILGAGWTSTFLLPHLRSHHPTISHAATTRDGRNGSIKWAWDAEDSTGSGEQYRVLPRARTVVITFPIRGVGGSRALVEGYEKALGLERESVRWVQLGSTGIWDGGPTLRSDEKVKELVWTDRHSTFDATNARAIAEEELLSVRSNSFVLNLSGLWGGSRDPINWVPRIAATKAALASKGSLHLIHGLDVSRAIIAVHLSPELPPSYSSTSSPSINPSPTSATSDSKQKRGERYLLTDMRVYDWWDLVAAWGIPGSEDPDKQLQGEQPKWVLELMEEGGVRSLPRTPEMLGRALDSTEFWRDFKLMPVRGRIERGRL